MTIADEGKASNHLGETSSALSADEERALFLAYKRNPSEENINRIIEQFKNLVFYIVHRYFATKEHREDLIQVGMMGLVLAIQRFEPERNLRFTTYAYQTIRGEIQRYVRDKSWSISVPRVLKERSLKVMTAENLLALKRGHAPTPKEIAEETGLSEEEVLEAMEIGTAYHPLQMLEEISPAEVEISRAEPSDVKGLESVERELFWEHVLSILTEVEAEVIRLRFWEGLAQREVAERLGTSQMNISRIQRQALNKLRKALGAGNELQGCQ